MRQISDISRWNRASAALGAVVWLAFGVLSWLDILPLELIEHLFLLAPFVIVPLGLGLMDSDSGSARWLAVGSFLQPFAATLALTSFFLPEGTLAAVLASAWLCTGLLLGVALPQGRIVGQVQPGVVYSLVVGLFARHELA